MNLTLLLLSWCWGCRPGEPPSPTSGQDDTGTTPVTTTDSGGDTEDTEDTENRGTMLEGACEPPSPLPEDPITERGSLEDKDVGKFYELTDLEVYPEQDLAVASGQGGLLFFDISSEEPELLHQEPEERQERFVKMVRLGEGEIAATNWNAIFETDFAIYDISNPLAPIQKEKLDIELATGMGWRDGILYLLSLDGKLHLLDASDTSNVSEIVAISGLESPYEMVIEGDWGFIADTTLGLVPVDLSVPLQPRLEAAVPSAVGAWDLDADETHVFVAAGHSGILVYDRSDPSEPELVAHLDDVGSIVGIDVDGDVLAAVSHHDLVLFDVSDRTSPLSLGKQANNQFGLAVQIAGDQVHVADWGLLSVWNVDTTVRSPEADFQASVIYFHEGGGTHSMEVTNLGADTLELVGASVSDDRVSMTASGQALEPGESTEVAITFAETDEDATLEASLCLATNDPDEPVVEIPLLTTSVEGLAEQAVGQVAPDFTLESIDGESHRLSDQLGSPVVLIYFATW